MDKVRLSQDKRLSTDEALCHCIVKSTTFLVSIILLVQVSAVSFILALRTEEDHAQELYYFFTGYSKTTSHPIPLFLSTSTNIFRETSRPWSEDPRLERPALTTIFLSPHIPRRILSAISCIPFDVPINQSASLIVSIACRYLCGIFSVYSCSNSKLVKQNSFRRGIKGEASA
jgi:hypothetical protein